MLIRLVNVWNQHCTALRFRHVQGVLLWAMAILLVTQLGVTPAWGQPHTGVTCPTQTTCGLTCEGDRELQRSLPSVRHRLTSRQAHVSPKPLQVPDPPVPTTAFPVDTGVRGQSRLSRLSDWQVTLPPPSDVLLRGPPLPA